MKKNILSIILVGILIFSGIGVLASDNQLDISESIKITKPAVTDNEEYINIDFQERTSFIKESGKPMLPIVSKTYRLPFGSKIKNIEVSFSSQKEIVLNNYVKPATGLQPLNSVKNNYEKPTLDTSIYESSDLYPSKNFTYNLGAGLDGDEHVIYLSINCYPIKYNPSKNIILYSENIDIDVSYKKPRNPVFVSDKYDLVIISPDRFSSTLQPLIDHKISYDISTMLKTTEEIFLEYNGRDKPERVKYFIKDAIETYGAKYALLIGDMDLMPMRLTDINIYNQEGIPTDLYYADIYDANGTFCTWDTDNDNKFGEYDWREGDIDFVDLYADIKVGRIPCKNNLELKIAIGKIINYETQSYNSEWFKRAVLMGGDTFPGRSIYEGEVVTEEVSNQLSEFNNIKLWTSTDNFKPRIINREISKGAGFVSYSGHGYELGFGTSPPNEEERIEYFIHHTLGMQNGNKYPIVFFDACSTARIDYTLSGFKVPCFAWYLILKPFGGAVATIGATRVAFTMVDNEGIHGGAGFMNVHFFKAYEPGIMVSEMLVSAQNDYLNQGEWKDCITLEEFNLLGDPSLKVGGYPPSEYFDVKISNDKLNGYVNIPVEFKASTTHGIGACKYSWDFDEDGIYDDSNGRTTSHTWYKKGVYFVGVKVQDENNNVDTYRTTIYIESKPNRPDGISSGEAGVEYTYSTHLSINPPLDGIYYIFNWGDGTTSQVLGPYNSDETVEVSHTFSKSGSYNIRTKALLMDSNGHISEETGWSDPLSVSMPKNNAKELSIILFEKSRLLRFIRYLAENINLF